MKKQDVQSLLEKDILHFWLSEMMDHERGGFFGRMDGENQLHPDAERGAILNARLLWTFSAAYRVLNNKTYLDAATWAKDYFDRYFLDEQYGGVYWSVDANGQPLDTKKQSYAIGFAIYGYSEYARATGDNAALETAISLFHDLENHAFDNVHNGYIEAFTREWAPIEDMRLSDKDENMSKTMNTHLHILEPYTNLYRALQQGGATHSDTLKLVDGRLRNLLHLFTHELLNEQTFHLDLFFDNEWNGQRNLESFGHDIEASWLMHETALVINDAVLLGEIEPYVKRIALAANEGLNLDGSMIYERNKTTHHVDRDLHWWVQCENAVGQYNLYQYFGDREALQRAEQAYQFIVDRLVDKRRGEFYWSIKADGTVNHQDDKAGFWKCPYHNGRMCLELIERMK